MDIAIPENVTIAQSFSMGEPSVLYAIAILDVPVMGEKWLVLLQKDGSDWLFVDQRSTAISEAAVRTAELPGGAPQDMTTPWAILLSKFVHKHMVRWNEVLQEIHGTDAIPTEGGDAEQVATQLKTYIQENLRVNGTVLSLINYPS